MGNVKDLERILNGLITMEAKRFAAVTFFKGEVSGKIELKSIPGQLDAELKKFVIWAAIENGVAEYDSRAIKYDEDNLDEIEKVAELAYQSKYFTIVEVICGKLIKFYESTNCDKAIECAKKFNIHDKVIELLKKDGKIADAALYAKKHLKYVNEAEKLYDKACIEYERAGEFEKAYKLSKKMKEGHKAETYYSILKLLDKNADINIMTEFYNNYHEKIENLTAEILIDKIEERISIEERLKYPPERYANLDGWIDEETHHEIERIEKKERKGIRWDATKEVFEIGDMANVAFDQIYQTAREKVLHAIVKRAVELFKGLNDPPHYLKSNLRTSLENYL